jgi:hypothetical protein
LEDEKEVVKFPDALSLALKASETEHIGNKGPGFYPGI